MRLPVRPVSPLTLIMPSIMLRQQTVQCSYTADMCILPMLTPFNQTSDYYQTFVVMVGNISKEPVD